jgi:hypothetical protein
LVPSLGRGRSASSPHMSNAPLSFSVDNGPLAGPVSTDMVRARGDGLMCGGE